MKLTAENLARIMDLSAVRTDVEMAEVAKNELMNNALVEALNRKISTLRLAIRRGG